MTPDTQTRQLPQPRRIPHPRDPHVQQRRRRRAIQQRLRQRHLRPPTGHGAIPAPTPTRIHQARSFHTHPADSGSVRSLAAYTLHRRASHADTPPQTRESPRRARPGSEVMSSCLAIKQLHSFVAEEAPIPPNKFRGRKNPFTCIDPEIAKTDIQFFASPHRRRPQEARYAANPPGLRPARSHRQAVRQRAVLRRHRARARAPTPSTAAPWGDGSPSGQTGAAAARGEARTLTALLRLRPGGRRYVHPRRRAAPSCSTGPDLRARGCLHPSPGKADSALIDQVDPIAACAGVAGERPDAHRRSARRSSSSRPSLTRATASSVRGRRARSRAARSSVRSSFAASVTDADSRSGSRSSTVVSTSR